MLNCPKAKENSVTDGLRANSGNILLMLASVVGGLLVQTAIAANATQAATARKPGQIDPCVQLSNYLPDSLGEFKETIATEFKLESPNASSVRAVTTIRNRKGHDPREVLEQHKMDLGPALIGEKLAAAASGGAPN